MGARRDIHSYEGAHLSSHCPDDLTSMAVKRGHLERLTYKSSKCSTTIAFVTFYDVTESTVCPQLLYVIAWTSILFRWFGHAAWHSEGALICDLFLPASLPNWRKRVGGQLKTWARQNQGRPSSTIRSPSSWSSAIESWLACHFVWPGSGSANVSVDGSRCCTCSGGSPVQPDQGESRYKSSQTMG